MSVLFACLMLVVFLRCKAEMDQDSGVVITLKLLIQLSPVGGITSGTE